MTSNGTTFAASSFLRFYSTGKADIHNTTFSRNTESADEATILITTAEQISLDNSSLNTCPLAYAIEKDYYHYYGADDRNVSALTLSCRKCDYNLYSLQRGTGRGLNVESSFQCLQCPRGAVCVPFIRSKSNFWGYKTGSNPPTLAFITCPFGYCNSPPSDSTEYNACQGKRTGFMCGMCSSGYSEALWSTNCTLTRDCNDYWFWIVFLVYVFLMAALVVFKPPLIKYPLRQIFWFKTFIDGSRFANSQTALQRHVDLIPEDDTEQNNPSLSSLEKKKQDKRQFSGLLEIIFYFYQISQLLLWSTSLTEFFETEFLMPVLGFFNFQPGVTNHHGFVCPIPGLTPKTKLLFKVAPVFGTLAAIFLLYSFHVLIRCKRGFLPPDISPYFQASVKTVFLSYVTLATVSISLIRCVPVEGKLRWFYNGNVLCYEWWQYASFIFNAVFVVPFIFVLAWIPFKLYKDKITVRNFLLAVVCPLSFLFQRLVRIVCRSEDKHIEESENLSALKELLLGPYAQPNETNKRGALYWQSILIVRRFILVVIFCIVTEPSFRSDQPV
ncbi:uncharacterized protein LOC114531480 [Dendronephthya gigantea]|uniref:uncharacterized protein LOC114531480 n=1 Tax=Dendronephthya gigantea TaxID=151771 RepID=UPI00106D9703|nr:uncharacterized protein LOC114531480 [Dendronephthya gigantea]